MRERAGRGVDGTRSSRDMAGRTCLVTGATDGHGKAMARALAARGAEVVLLARSREKARVVQDEIARESGGKAPDVLICDLASGAETEQAIASWLASGRRLDLLVNNAGLVSLSRRESEDGHELTFAVNYLATFRLCLGLLPRLRESAPARIVNIGSDSYRVGRLDFDDLQLERRYGMTRAYAQSKLAILYFSLELARRIRGSGVTVNVVDPGPVASNIGANNPGLAYRLIGPMIRALFPSPARAARTALRVATEPDLATVSGGYYRSMRRRAEPLEFDPETARRLWDASAELCGLERDPLA